MVSDPNDRILDAMIDLVEIRNRSYKSGQITDVNLLDSPNPQFWLNKVVNEWKKSLGNWGYLKTTTKESNPNNYFPEVEPNAITAL